MQANPICSPAPSSRQRCSSPSPGVASSTKGTCWCLYLHWPPAQNLIPKSPGLSCPGLPCPPVPGHLFSPCPKHLPVQPCRAWDSSAPEQTQQRPSQGQGSCCCSAGTGAVAEQSLRERSHIPQLSAGIPWGWRCSSQGWGLCCLQDPTSPHPRSEAVQTPPVPLPGSRCRGRSAGQHPHCGSAGGSGLFYAGCNGAGLAGQRRIPYSGRSRPTAPFPAPVPAGARSKDTPLSPVPRGLGTRRHGAGGRDGFASCSSQREGWHWAQ